MATQQINYRYSRSREAVIREQVSLALQSMFHLAATDTATDWQGQDYLYMVNRTCPLQLRCRDNRPVAAPDIDVTFRHTEPAMMAAGTYAPLALFLWFQSGVCVAGRLIDPYKLPSLAAYPITWNKPEWPGDTRRRGFVSVPMAELQACRALLRRGDGRNYQNEFLGALEATRRILDRWSQRPPPALSTGFF